MIEAPFNTISLDHSESFSSDREWPLRIVKRAKELGIHVEDNFVENQRILGRETFYNEVLNVVESGEPGLLIVEKQGIEKTCAFVVGPEGMLSWRGFSGVFAEFIFVPDYGLVRISRELKPMEREDISLKKYPPSIDVESPPHKDSASYDKEGGLVELTFADYNDSTSSHVLKTICNPDGQWQSFYAYPYCQREDVRSLEPGGNLVLYRNPEYSPPNAERTEKIGLTSISVEQGALVVVIKETKQYGEEKSVSKTVLRAPLIFPEYLVSSIQLDGWLQALKDRNWPVLYEWLKKREPIVMRTTVEQENPRGSFRSPRGSAFEV